MSIYLSFKTHWAIVSVVICASGLFIATYFGVQAVPYTVAEESAITKSIILNDIPVTFTYINNSSEYRVHKMFKKIYDEDKDIQAISFIRENNIYIATITFSDGKSEIKSEKCFMPDSP